MTPLVKRKVVDGQTRQKRETSTTKTTVENSEQRTGGVGYLLSELQPKDSERPILLTHWYLLSYPSTDDVTLVKQALYLSIQP